MPDFESWPPDADRTLPKAPEPTAAEPYVPLEGFAVHEQTPAEKHKVGPIMETVGGWAMIASALCSALYGRIAVENNDNYTFATAATASIALLLAGVKLVDIGTSGRAQSRAARRQISNEQLDCFFASDLEGYINKIRQENQ